MSETTIFPVRPNVAASRAQGIWDSYGSLLPALTLTPRARWCAAKCTEAERDAEEEREGYRIVARGMCAMSMSSHAVGVVIDDILGRALHGEAIGKAAPKESR